MKTKSHVRFLARASHLDADIELVNIIEILSEQHALSSTQNTYIFDGVNPRKHPILSNRSNTDNSRKLACNHLRATICEAFIKNIYEDLTSYFSEILFQASLKGLDPNRLIGSHQTQFQANEILQTGSWDAVVKLVSTSVFRKLENERSTKKLIEQMNDKLNLGVSLDIINNALPYLELRHLLVHNEGKVDQKFLSNFPNFNSKLDVEKKFPLNYSTISNARKKIYKLVDEFDKKIISNGVVLDSYMQP